MLCGMAGMVPPKRAATATVAPVPTLSLHHTQPYDQTLEGVLGTSPHGSPAQHAFAAGAQRFKSPRNHEQVDQQREQGSVPEPHFERPFKSPRNHEPLAHLSPPADAQHRRSETASELEQMNAQGEHDTEPRQSDTVPGLHTSSEQPESARKQIMFVAEPDIIVMHMRHGAHDQPHDTHAAHSALYAQHASRARSVDPEQGAPDDWYASPAAARSHSRSVAAPAHGSQRTGAAKGTVDYARLARPTSSCITRQQATEEQLSTRADTYDTCQSKAAGGSASHRRHSSYTGAPTRPVHNPRIDKLSTPKVRACASQCGSSAVLRPATSRLRARASGVQASQGLKKGQQACH